ncbi:unnamed protein product [Caenorhabditis bovis]|uniref:Uncharacterized protein n=1 Tax=Caenorhabditis bovis TaxID=2654633 RepID=A0A8S1EBY2_9PELO|nr:unnamed protein product [Caenorhabditis bovis]
MPLPISRPLDYDSDPEIQAEKELAKKDPAFAIDENSLISQKKAAANALEAAKVKTDGAIAAPITNGRSKSTDDVTKKAKVGNQTKALKKQRSRGISGCSSRKFSGYDDGYDLDDLDYDYERDVFDEFVQAKQPKKLAVDISDATNKMSICIRRNIESSQTLTW